MLYHLRGGGGGGGGDGGGVSRQVKVFEKLNFKIVIVSPLYFPYISF